MQVRPSSSDAGCRQEADASSRAEDKCFFFPRQRMQDRRRKTYTRLVREM